MLQEGSQRTIRRTAHSSHHSTLHHQTTSQTHYRTCGDLDGVDATLRDVAQVHQQPTDGVPVNEVSGVVGQCTMHSEVNIDCKSHHVQSLHRGTRHHCYKLLDLTWQCFYHPRTGYKPRIYTNIAHTVHHNQQQQTTSNTATINTHSEEAISTFLSLSMESGLISFMKNGIVRSMPG